MWVFTRSGLLSIVEHIPNPRYLQVRARQSHHITDNFPGTVPLYTPNADYHWRVVLLRDDVAEQLDRLVMDIDYPNFKDAANAELDDIYLRIWATGTLLGETKYARITTVGLNQSESSWTHDQD
jgi:hypothetical protein